MAATQEGSTVMGQPSLESRVHIYLVDYFRRHAALTLAWTL